MLLTRSWGCSASRPLLSEHLLLHFSFTSKWLFYHLFLYFFVDPLPSFNWWAVSVGGEELKWRQLAHHQLMSQHGPHFSPHSKAKANDKSTNLRKDGI